MLLASGFNPSFKAVLPNLNALSLQMPERNPHIFHLYVPKTFLNISTMRVGKKVRVSRDWLRHGRGTGLKNFATTFHVFFWYPF